MSLRRTLRGLGAGWLLRKSYLELRALRLAIEAQTAVLTRIAQQLCPEPPAAPSPGEIVVEAGALGSIDHLDPIEMALVEAFVSRTFLRTGVRPTEDQVLEYLAEEATQAQHAALNEQRQPEGTWR